MNDDTKQFRLRRFWGAAVFSLGGFWGVANIVYSPITVLTSIAGSSWLEVAIVLAGGLLTLTGSAAAFYRRGRASRILFLGGIVLFAAAAVGQTAFHANTSGMANLFLLFMAGAVPCGLGIFGTIAGRKDWPPLRAVDSSQQRSPRTVL